MTGALRQGAADVLRDVLHSPSLALRFVLPDEVLVGQRVGPAADQPVARFTRSVAEGRTIAEISLVARDESERILLADLAARPPCPRDRPPPRRGCAVGWPR